MDSCSVLVRLRLPLLSNLGGVHIMTASHFAIEARRVSLHSSAKASRTTATPCHTLAMTNQKDNRNEPISNMLGTARLALGSSRPAVTQSF